MRLFNKVRKELGFPKMRFQDLRHTAASLLLAQNVHPKVVQEMLGHSSFTCQRKVEMSCFLQSRDVRFLVNRPG